MAKNKKQHYVPKFYLKYFSNQRENTHLGLYHFKSSKLILAADLKNQAYEDYFHGKDAFLEEGLANLEEDASLVLKEIINSETIPKQGTKDYWLLWTFILVQAYRTLSSAKATNEMLSKTVKAIAKYEGELKDKLDNSALTSCRLGTRELFQTLKERTGQIGKPLTGPVIVF